MKRSVSLFLAYFLLISSAFATPLQEQLKSSLEKASFEISQLEELDEESVRDILEVLGEEISDLKVKGLTKEMMIDEIIKFSGDKEKVDEAVELIRADELWQLSQDEIMDLVASVVVDNPVKGSNYIAISIYNAPLPLVLFVLIIFIV